MAIRNTTLNRQSRFTRSASQTPAAPHGSAQQSSSDGAAEGGAAVDISTVWKPEKTSTHVRRRGSQQERFADLAVLNEERFRKDRSRWKTSPFEDAEKLSSTPKGALFEQSVEQWCNESPRSMFNVLPAPDSESDRLLKPKPSLFSPLRSEVRLEIKTSFSWDTGELAFSQFRDQNYDYALLIGVEPFQIHAWLIPKSVLLSNPEGMKSQHGGSGGSGTEWFKFQSSSPPDWLQDYGGDLAMVQRMLDELFVSRESFSWADRAPARRDVRRPGSSARFASVVAQGTEEFIKHFRRWDGSPFSYALSLSSRTKGAWGEHMAEQWMAPIAKRHGFCVKRSPDVEADRLLVSDSKTVRVEVKTSFEWSTGDFAFAQLRDQNYDFALLLGIQPSDVSAWLIPKAVLMSDLEGLEDQHHDGTTKWMKFQVGHHFPWMDDFGGDLTSVRRLLDSALRRTDP